MSKGIIVVDMPEKCCNCAMGFHNECSDRFECFLEPTKELNDPDHVKPNWCPIKPIPEKAHHTNHCDNGRYDKGWNECIDEILKEAQ